MKVKRAYKLLMLADEDNTIDVSKACRIFNASPSTVRKYLHQLISEGFVEKTADGRFVLSKLGISIRNFASADSSRDRIPNYVITDVETGQPIPLSFKSYEQLLSIINYELAPKQVLEEHLKKYMIEWIRNSMKDELLAEKIAKGEIRTVDDLKKYLEFILTLIESLRSG
ncbi:MAG: MarR family transcriptional regulator [Thermosphaera sp.]